jgi:glycosyltransferase involved in cell wall biosynthesis
MNRPAHDPTVPAPHRADGAPTDPLVSVVIPCYKGARYLAEAIESCLGQTYRAVEVILVDDASPDECHDIARQYAHADPRVKVLSHETNGGVSRAFNTGFRHASGQFFTRLAQDDRFVEGAVAAMVRRLLADPKAHLVYADFETIDEAGRVQSRIELPAPRDALYWGNGLGVCVMWRREVRDRVGEFDPAFDAAEDFEYWARAAEHFAVAKVEGPPLLQFRVHGAMGSVVHVERQERASLRIRRRQLEAAPALSYRSLMLHRSLSHHYYSFAQDHTAGGNYWGALRRMALSFAHWPLPYPRARVKTSWARAKLLTAIVLRLFRRPAAARPAQVAEDRPTATVVS